MQILRLLFSVAGSSLEGRPSFSVSQSLAHSLRYDPRRIAVCAPAATFDIWRIV